MKEPVVTKRILLVSSNREEAFEMLSDAEQFALRPYSLNAILYNLRPLGWETARAGWRTARSLKTLAAKIDAFRPDIVYTYGSTVALNPLVCRRRCRHKTFKVVHGWDDLYGDIWGDLFGWPGRVLMNVMERQIVTRSDAVVTLSYFLQRRGARWGVDCHYIPNGADVPEAVPGPPGIRLEGEMNLVYTGDQARWKRTADICAAMRRVPQNVKLYLTGRRYAYLERYASGNCIFLGFVSREDQLGVMRQADVFVTTANQDCNAKLQEYLRFGKPILGYDDRPNLFFRNGHNALLTKDYASAVMALYGDPVLRRRLAENAAREIPVFTWREIAGQFDGYFRGLLKPGVHDHAKR